MKRLGILGGMSWESTQLYYQWINRQVHQRLGGLHSANLVMVSVDFHGIEALQRRGDWEALARLLASYAQDLVAAGAEGVLIATNTMHRVAPEVQAAIPVPLLHIADCTGQVLQDKGYHRVGLLGTRFTMEGAFYKDRLEHQWGARVLTPEAAMRDRVHQVIYQELCLGQVLSASKQDFITAIDQLHQRGAEAVILGCTEIGLLVQQEDTRVPLLDTTQIHAQEAVRWALS